MPREIYEDLTPRGQEICAKIVALDDGDEMERASRAPQPPCACAGVPCVTAMVHVAGWREL